MTLLLGKDPCMVIGLNSYAVSDSDLKAALINSRGWTSYINRQTLANTIEAARVFWERYPRLFVQSERDRDNNEDEEEGEKGSSKGSSRVKRSVSLFNEIRRHCGGQILASDCPNGWCPCLDNVDVPDIPSGVMQTIKNRIAYSANLPYQYAFQCVGGTEVFFLADTGREMINPRLQAAKDGAVRRIDGFTYTTDRSKFAAGSVCIFTGTTYGHIAYLVDNNKIIETNALEKPGGGDLHMRTLSSSPYGSSLQLAGCHVPNDAL
jgi:hypothetical protein